MIESASAIPNTLADDTLTPLPTSNQPPIANAGLDQTVDAGQIVTLDGSGSSDSDGSITSYSWTQTEGPFVTLDDYYISTPEFTAPADITNDTDLSFEMTVTDDMNASNTATVRVKVTGGYTPPPAPDIIDDNAIGGKKKRSVVDLI